VLEDLVLAAAAINDGHLDSIFECKLAFADLWGLEVEIDELRPVIKDLIERKRMEKQGNGFRLSAEVLGLLNARARQWDETEDRAFREWELAVRTLRPGVSEEDMRLLRCDLREWLHEIIVRHGAEAAMLLYPEQERARRFFQEVDARGFEKLPEHDVELCALREKALPLFIRGPTPDQRRFLAGLLNTSFYMCVLTIDPAAKNLVQEQMKGRRIYLDTNFLYAVLGAAPPDEVYSSRRLVKLCRELGFELAITPWTMNELRTSIGRARRAIEEQRQFIRPELAETMLRVSGDKGFSRFFWQAYNEKRTRPADVFDRLEHFDTELDRYDLKEVTESCEAIARQEERIRDYASLLNSERWPDQKDWVVLEHDAKCRLLVEQLRGAGNMRVSNARYWFLTYDGKLPRFARRVPDNGDPEPELPFCVSPSAWVQIIRALTPRTEDFETTVVDLLTSPFVGYRRAVDPAVVQEVVGRIDHYDDASPETALAVLTDTAKVQEIEQAVSTEDENAVEQTVAAAYSTKAREMEEAVAASLERAAAADAARVEAEARIAKIEEAHARTQELAEQTEHQLKAAWETERQDLQHQIDRTAENLDAAERDANERIRKLEHQRAKDEQRRQRNLRIAAGLTLIVLGLIVGVVPSLALVSGKWAIAGVAVAGAAIVLIGVRLVAGSKIGGEFWMWITALAAVAAVAVGVAASITH
jgi:hypothetical protein